jgi:hypothetical protein
MRIKVGFRVPADCKINLSQDDDWNQVRNS